MTQIELSVNHIPSLKSRFEISLVGIADVNGLRLSIDRGRFARKKLTTKMATTNNIWIVHI